MLALVVFAVAVALVVLTRTGAVDAALRPTAVADATTLSMQRAAAERAIQRAYVAALDQLQKSRQLKLAITETQANDIFSKGQADLKALRHSALVSMAQTFGSTAAEAEPYAVATEQRLDASPVPERGLNEPVLLAPKLFAIVQRMGEVTAQITDRTIRQLTVPPTPRPSSSP
jgi:hypothetical protein